MKFSDLATKLKEFELPNSEAQSKLAISEIQEKYLFDISGAEAGCSGSGGTGVPFNAFCSWSKSF